MLRQKKVTKEKASQRPCPCGLPCATRAARGRAQTRCAQTSARPDPVAAALLSTATWRGGRVCSFAGAHIAHASWRAGRAVAAAATTAAAPSPNPFATTASFTSLGKQTYTAAPRFKNTSPKLKKPNGLFQLPFTPGGVMGRGGSGGQTKVPQRKAPNKTRFL